MTAPINQTESRGADTPTPARAHINPGDIIPVGEEPRLCEDTHNTPTSGTGAAFGDSGTVSEGLPGSQRPRKDSNGQRRPIRKPEAFYACRNQLIEQGIFRSETMRHLRRAEICVWQAIHGCQGKEGARISQQRIAELAGITSKRHIGEAIKALCDKGLLEVLSKGRYRPNGADGFGLASRYRAYPRPESRLARIALEKPKRRPGLMATTDAGPNGLQRRKAK